MNDKVADFLETYSEVAERCQTLTFLPRDIKLQKSAVRDADELIHQAFEVHNEVVKEGDEEAANQLLALRCLTRSVRAELLMWIQLKKSNWNAAWHALVDSQEYARSSQAAHNLAKECNAENHLKKLESIEHLVFPPQVFNSPGLKVNEYSCSICGEDYEECDHLAGLPYWGRFCVRIYEDVEAAREVSIVDSPEDKKARVTHFSTEEGTVRNRMTWAESDPDEVGMEVKEEGMTTSGVVMTADDVDPIYELEELVE